MRLAAALALGAVAVCVAGCASPATRVSPAAPGAASSQPVSGQPVSTQVAISQVAPSAAPSGALSSGALSSGAASSGAAVAAGPASESALGPSASLSVDPALEKRLWALAVSAATSEGGTAKVAEAVGSTHAHAVAVTMSDGVEGDQPVWVVQVEGVGEFVCGACSVPPGASAPHGRFQLLIVDASTFRTLDFGLADTSADLTKLGPVTELHS
jgi:hypothetical protein